MLDPTIESELKKAFRQNVLIYAALIGSMFVFTGIVEFMKRSAPQTGQVINLTGPDANIFRNVLIVLALLEYFLIRFFKSKALSRISFLNTIINTRSPFSPRVRQLMAVSSVTYVLCYSVVTYGFVLFFLSGITTNFYIFMVIALVFFALFRPQYSQWTEWMESRGQDTSV